MKEEKLLSTENELLKIEFDLKNITFDVLQKKSNTSWKMFDGDGRDFRIDQGGGSKYRILPPVKSIDKEKYYHSLSSYKRIECFKETGKMLIKLSGFKDITENISTTISIWLEGNAVNFSIYIDSDYNKIEFVDMFYPRGFCLKVNKENYVVFPVGQGELLPASSTEKVDAYLGYYPFMPFFGGKQGKGGFCVIIETPYDYYLSYMNHGSGPIVGVRWLHSLKKFGYERKVKYVFMENVSYVDIAKEYRRYAKDIGELKTLKEKVKENKRVARLIGGMVVTDSICMRDFRNLSYDVLAFDSAGERIEQFYKITDQKNVVYHLDGWERFGYDNTKPDILPPNPAAGGVEGLRSLSTKVRNLGYLFLLHDNYNYMSCDSEAFSEDISIMEETGRIHKKNWWAGGLNTEICPIIAIEYLKRNYVDGKHDYHPGCPGLFEICGPTATYLDEFMPAPSKECYNPEHLLNRKSYMEAMLEMIKFMRKNKLVVSSERVSHAGIPYYDFVWANDYSKMGIEVPLYSLVFHDCLVVPWVFPVDINNKKGWKQVFFNCLLSGGIPLIAHKRGEDKDAGYRGQAAKILSQIHEEIGLKEHTSHKIINDDVDYQESVFGDVVIKADIKKGIFTIKGLTNLKGEHKIVYPFNL